MSDLKFIFKNICPTTTRCVNAAMFANKSAKNSISYEPGRGLQPQPNRRLSFCTNEQEEARALNTLIKAEVLPRLFHQASNVHIYFVTIN